MVNAPSVDGATATANADGTITYTSPPDYYGSDTFTYEVCATGSPALCTNAEVAVQVMSTPDVPTIRRDDVTVDKDKIVKVAVLSNDTDVDGEDDLRPAFLKVVSAPRNGSVEVGDGFLTYKLSRDFAGKDTFTYEVCDNGEPSKCAEATVTMSVRPMPDDCTIKGTDGKDVLRGTANRDVICGRGNNDTIRGMDGNDLILGGSDGGKDTIYGGAGNDTVSGGAGNDTLYGQDGNDVLRGNNGVDKLYGGADNNTMSGGAGTDVVEGGSGDNLVVQ